MSSKPIYGSITQELWYIWTKYADRTVNASILSKLFHDLDLFPSQSQIFEMVQCARECSNPVSMGKEDHEIHQESPKYLTFGEFCGFATELRKFYQNHQIHSKDRICTRRKGEAKKAKPNLTVKKSTSSAFDVFLGGSCNPTTWRQDVAMPHLKSQGITFYNPQQDNWVPEMIELEHQAKETAKLLFFVIKSINRNVVSMIEVAYLAGARRDMIAVLYPYLGPGQLVAGETMSEREHADLSQALTTVHDLVEREGLPVFDDLDIALNCCTKVLKENVSIEDLGIQDSAQPVRLAHLRIGDKMVRLREAFDTLDTSKVGKISLSDVRMAFRIHAHHDLTSKDMQKILKVHGIKQVAVKDGGSSQEIEHSVMIDFDHFCCIVAEFKNLSRKSREAKKTSHLINSITTPFQKLSRFMSIPFAKSQQGSQIPLPNLKRKGSDIRDIYLGGSMTGIRWRENEAIPLLKKHGLTYFNPVTSSSSSSTNVAWVRRLIPLETTAMDNSRVLLFVILDHSRSLGAMCEAAYYIGKGATVVLCVQKILEPFIIDEKERLSPCALADYNRGRNYLSDFANRNCVPVFEDILEAIECALQKCKNIK